MLKRPTALTRLLCKWFHLQPIAPPASPPPSLSPWWEDLWEYRDFRPIWPRMLASDAWKRDFEPYFKRALLETLVAQIAAPTPEAKLRLEVRAELLHQFLAEARYAGVRDDANLNAAFHTGNRAALDSELNRVNAPNGSGVPRPNGASAPRAERAPHVR